MAYNVLKGIVEGSVDQHADQEIEGIKVFKSTISASMFYDTDAGSPCATENNVAITTLTSQTESGIITYHGGKIAKSNHNLTFDGKVLKTDEAHIGVVHGSGAGLRNVPAEHLSGKVSAQSIDFGPGLKDRQGSLSLNLNDGLSCDTKGLSVELFSNGGLDFKNNKLFVNPNNALDVQESGQNISDTDIVLMYDISRANVRSTSFKNLYDGYLSTKVPRPAGSKNSIQFKGNKSFNGSDSLTFEPTQKRLNLKGTLTSLAVKASSVLESNGSLVVNGGLFKSICTVNDENYIVADVDNTILCNTSNNSVSITLPAANENMGRIITIKKICDSQDKYKIKNSNTLTIRTTGELIDFTTNIALKANYSIRTLQSDGNKWWIINKTGS